MKSNLNLNNQFTKQTALLYFTHVGSQKIQTKDTVTPKNCLSKPNSKSKIYPLHCPFQYFQP